jgi:three-Cys-motif partner protein
MGKKVSDFDWLKKRLNLLLKYLPELSEIEKEVYNDANYWAALKIIALAYFSGRYAQIISNQGWIKKMYYIDLFSGSGLCCLKDGEIILGSPIAVADSTRFTPFDQMYLVEKNSTKSKAIESRLNYLKSEFSEFNKTNYKTLNGDCNDCVQDIIDEIVENSENQKDYHCLVFIDPYGMEIDWSTVESLLNIQSDVIISFQSFLIAYRAVGKARTSNKDRDRLNRFMGREIDIDKIDNPVKLLSEYKKNLESHKDITIHCPIKGMKETAFYYDWILTTKRTKSGSPWIKIAIGLKKRIENLDGSKVKKALRQLQGKEASLDFFKTPDNLDKWFK